MQKQWTICKNNMIWNYIQTKKLFPLPLICTPFPQASLVPNIPCLTDSGTNMQGLHFCSFHLWLQRAAEEHFTTTNVQKEYFEMMNLKSKGIKTVIQ